MNSTKKTHNDGSPTGSVEAGVPLASTSELLDNYESTARMFLEHSPFIEIRVVGGGPAMSGIFNDARTAAQAAARLDGSRNAYLVANQIRADFPPSSIGEVRRAGSGACVADADIAKRRWFLIDIDCKTKGKSSATEAELELVAAASERVAEFLQGLGWPSPTIAFSGNGEWLLYRVDQPNDVATKDLYEDALVALGTMFNDTAIEIDKSAGTAARILPFFGTMKMKGANNSDRPHRRSRIMDMGSEELVTLEQLKQLAAMKPTPGEAAPPLPSGKGFMKLEQILKSAGVDYINRAEAGGVTWFGISGPDGNCPFGDSSGNGGKCGVGQDKAGKLYGKCFAAEHPWAEWKELLGLSTSTSPASNDGRPVIVLGDEMNIISSLSWEALILQNNPPTLFAFGDMLVEVL